MTGGLMMNTRSFKKAILALCLVSATTLSVPALAAGVEPGVIHVRGYAQQDVAPDTAYVTIGMESTNKDAEAARTENNTVMTNVRNALEGMGIAKEDMKTTNFYMNPNYDNKNRSIVSYTVTNSLQVKVTNLDMIPRLIAKAGALNANKLQGIRFTTERADQIKANLIKEAIRNGKQAAQAAAVAAGSQLGQVKEINLNDNSPSYDRVAYSGATLLRANAKVAEFAPIEAGTNTISESVDLTFYLQ